MDDLCNMPSVSSLRLTILDRNRIVGRQPSGEVGLVGKSVNIYIHENSSHCTQRFELCSLIEICRPWAPFGLWGYE